MSSKESLSSFASRRGLCKSVNPLGTNKEVDHGYLSNVYQPVLEQVKIEKVLEIGLMWGFSLRLWHEYLCPKVCVGIENGASVSQKDFGSSLSPLVINKSAFRFTTYRKLPRDFDLIVDDANHTLYQQSRSTNVYSKRLATQGVLVIEDLQPEERYVRNVLNSIPPFQPVKIYLVDLSAQANRLPNSICIVIQKLSKGSDQGLQITNHYWKELAQKGILLRMCFFVYQKLFFCPYQRIKTSLTYRINKIFHQLI